MSNKFIAIFYRKYSSDNRLWVSRTAKIDFRVLHEKTNNSKAYSEFSFKKGSYMFNPECVVSYSKKGEPIIKYVEGKFEPFIDEKSIDIVCKTNAFLKNKIFDRNELRAVIQASQKTNPKIDWVMTIVFIAVGFLAGYVASGFIK